MRQHDGFQLSAWGCRRRHVSIKLSTGGDMRTFSWLQKAKWEHSVICMRRNEGLQLAAEGDMRTFSCLQKAIWEHSVACRRRHESIQLAAEGDMRAFSYLQEATWGPSIICRRRHESIPAKTTHWYCACITLGHRLAHRQCVVLAIMRPSESASAIQRSRWVRTLDSFTWHSVISLDSPYIPCFFNHQDGDNWWPKKHCQYCSVKVSIYA